MKINLFFYENNGRKNHEVKDTKTQRFAGYKKYIFLIE